MPTADFADVPTFRGERLNVAQTQAEYDFYIGWLANYLFRPAQGVPPLEYDEARHQLVSIEIEMAEALWFQPPEVEYLPRIGPLHADYSFRERLSSVLSCVCSEPDRVALLDWLYREYERDALK